MNEIEYQNNLTREMEQQEREDAYYLAVLDDPQGSEIDIARGEQPERFVTERDFAQEA